MPQFALTTTVTVTAITEVTAKTRAAACEIAEGREVVLGGLGSGADPAHQWVIEEADGEIQDIHFEE